MASFSHSGLLDSRFSKVNIVTELLCNLYNYIHVAALSSHEVEFMIESLCTD